MEKVAQEKLWLLKKILREQQKHCMNFPFGSRVGFELTSPIVLYEYQITHDYLAKTSEQNNVGLTF